MNAPPPEPLWSVSSLCAAIDDAFARSWPTLSITGEISNFTVSGSGHAYFSLKDAEAQLRCVAFRRCLAQLDFMPASGQQVQVRARLSLYQPRGDLQLVVEHMARPSAGVLHEQFLRLKAQLEAEGLFAPERKRPLPAAPQCIGLVTSAAGAALHDVRQTLARRAPHVRVLFAPASVQGATAPAELITALRALYTQPALDAILLVRGGGSAEDLAAFNDEALARTIAASPVPLISGVGHETDFSIADFVADQRAPTPTAAAELVAPERTALLQELAEIEMRLTQQLRRRLQNQTRSLDQHELQLRHLRRHTLQTQSAQWQAQSQRLAHGLAHLLASSNHRLNLQGLRLQQSGQSLQSAYAHQLHLQQWQCRSALAQNLANARQLLSHCERRLLAEQSRRAARTVLLQREDGHTVTHLADVALGQTVLAQLQDGQLQLTVQSKAAPKTPTQKKTAH